MSGFGFAKGSRSESGRRAIVAAALLAVALPACRSGQGPSAAPATAPAAPAGVAQLVGQTRVLRHRGDERKLALKRDDLARLAGDCDAVVEVTQAALEQGTLRLSLSHVGRPEVVTAKGRPVLRRRACVPASTVTVTVSKMSGDSVPAALDALLPTLERYLELGGVSFSREPAEPTALVADNLVGATAEGRTAARQVTAWPAPLLKVDTEVARTKTVGARENEVDFTAVVGTDGRLHAPKVGTTLAENHARQVEKVLLLWRYQPAKAGDHEVPAHIEGKAVLRLY